jgi:hypothetical protein
MKSRFVILEHTGHGPLHYDLMLAVGETLATWQLTQPPTMLAAGKDIPAKQLADHRIDYLDYEGDIGEDRGRVQRVEEGVFELLDQTDERWTIRLAGNTLQGEFLLCRTHTTESGWVVKKLPRL